MVVWFKWSMLFSRIELQTFESCFVLFVQFLLDFVLFVFTFCLVVIAHFYGAWSLFASYPLLWMNYLMLKILWMKKAFTQEILWINSFKNNVNWIISDWLIGPVGLRSSLKSSFEQAKQVISTNRGFSFF